MKASKYFIAGAILSFVAFADAYSVDTIEERQKPILIISNEKASWFDASSFCIARGMDFLSIETKEEFEFVAGQILASGLQNENVWIGGTEIGSENSYYWVHTNSPVELSYWDPTEVPAVANRCMVFNKSLWRHAACSALNYFVCETLEDATTSSTPLQDFSE